MEVVFTKNYIFCPIERREMAVCTAFFRHLHAPWYSPKMGNLVLCDKSLQICKKVEPPTYYATALINRDEIAPVLWSSGCDSCQTDEGGPSEQRAAEHNALTQEGGALPVKIQVNCKL